MGDETTQVRLFESDKERVHEIKRMGETWPEAMRRVIDQFERCEDSQDDIAQPAD